MLIFRQFKLLRQFQKYDLRYGIHEPNILFSFLGKDFWDSNLFSGFLRSFFPSTKCYSRILSLLLWAGLWCSMWRRCPGVSPASTARCPASRRPRRSASCSGSTGTRPCSSGSTGTNALSPACIRKFLVRSLRVPTKLFSLVSLFVCITGTSVSELMH